MKQAQGQDQQVQVQVQGQAQTLNAKLEQLGKFTIGCIFDGHSGWRCAQYLSQHFVSELVQHASFLEKQCDKALVDTCAAMDYRVCDLLLDEEDASGCTGVVAVYDGRRNRFTVASVGDSMCVLSRSGIAVMLNKMHRVDNEEEKERVIRAGGTIVNHRVNGLLAITRAFGDTQFKAERDEQNPTMSQNDLVISRPEIHSEVITPMTEFAVVASDGLWDVMTAQAAVTFVRRRINEHRDLEAAARELTNEALKRGSVDNVTALIMTFHFAGESISAK
ncbi:phosphatase 2C-like domain-containing protein [Ochromonadaceae sp. CCMP2298]|nr:phosphatase 2C-like domain-containing protein [Ochromonadaceae sp. CCMP2298]